ncbi:MAG: hypothetical protein U0Q07_09450 [Acidimicrobiales bacterium]
MGPPRRIAATGHPAPIVAAGLAAVVALVAAVLPLVAALPPAGAVSRDTRALHLIAPVRALDTRDGTGLPGRTPTTLGPTSTTTLAVTDPARTTAGHQPLGIPAGATAVAVNLTATDTTAPTFITAWATGTPRPPTSNLNPTPDHVTANLTVIPLAPDGTLTLFNNSGTTHLIADLQGWYEASPVGALVGDPGALRTPAPLPPDVQASATGDPARSIPLDGWRWPAGTSAFFPALADDGRVLMGTMSQVANQVVPTQDTMSVAAYDPLVGRFTTTPIDTRAAGQDPAGRLGPRAVELGARHVGGGDVSDVCAVPGANRAIALTAMPYKRWQRAQQGDEHQLLQLRSDPSVAGGGTFRLRWSGGAWSTPIAFGAAAPTVATALAALPEIGGSANVAVTGLLAPTGQRRFVVVLRGAFHGVDVPPLEVDASGLTGSGPEGWVDDHAYGSYPAVTVLDTSGPDVTEARSGGQLGSLTPDDLHAAALAGGDATNADAAFPTWFDSFLGQPDNAFGESGFRDARGLVECDVLPASHHVVAAQYFNSTESPNGSLVVLDATGALHAYCGPGQRHAPSPGAPAVPQCTLPPAAALPLAQPIHQKQGDACVTTSTVQVSLLPRDVRASPVAVGGAEHLTVVYDAPYTAWDDTCSTATVRGYPAPVQELRYDDAAGTLTPVSPVLVAPTREAGTIPAFMTAAYADDGTLFLAVANHSGSLATTWPLYVAAVPMAADGSHLTPPGFVHDPAAAVTPVGTATPATTADLTLLDDAGHRTGGFLAALEWSPRHQTLLYAYQYGRVRPFAWDGHTLTPEADVEVGSERQHTAVAGDPPLGVAKGVVDDRRDALYVVLAGYAPTTTWAYDTPPAVIDQQYLVAVDLTRALDPHRAPAGAPPAAGGAVGSGGAAAASGGGSSGADGVGSWSPSPPGVPRPAGGPVVVGRGGWPVVDATTSL